MNGKFEEISLMLDSIKGGQAGSGLFNGSTDPMAIKNCSEGCITKCPNGSIGTYNGNNNGLVYPDPVVPVPTPDPPIPAEPRH